MSGFGTIGREEWTNDAKCVTISVDDADLLLYPPDPNNMHPGKTFCNGRKNTHGAYVEPPCPVRAECLAFAMKTEDRTNRHGVWGGKSPRERHAHAKKLAEAV